ncbi:hypothetical protein IQ216_03115, partial [Cyanobium sp. LEGE 06143]|uniref:hypothetical protein n=1 Tax=Cyanobium sp. LEGE 06143 TaxID=945727 RepID=UPI00188139BD
AGPALSLSLEQLRQLPLTPEARLALLQDLRAGAGTGGEAAALQAELAEVTLRCCEDAYGRGAWLEALEHHDALLELVAPLAAALPEQAPGYWSRYGELLAFLTAAVHGAATNQSSDPPSLPLRAELCWRLAQRLRLAAELPFEPPYWLPVLEQQLVQDGAGFWRQLLQEREQEPERAVARRRAVELLLRLHALLEPPPAWMLQQARQLVQEQAAAVLAQQPPQPREVAALVEALELLPVAEERQPELEAALTRARLALELLAPELVPLVPPTAGPEAPTEPAEAGLAELVLLPEGAEATPLQWDLSPLLAVEFGAIDTALEDFVWHLPKGSRARPAAGALGEALEGRWRMGLRLAPDAFERLAYAAAAWQRRLEERLEPPPALDWQHSVLVELDATELAVLQLLLAQPQALAEPLAELRREHHNPAFWQQRQEVAWMEAPPPLEALRRLHLEAGFYGSSHEPLASLQAWGREAWRLLLEAELWTDDAGCLGRWLALAQELAARGEAPLPALGTPPAAETLLAGLGGLEVVYAGDQAGAVQEAHRAGRCFSGEPFGLRVLEAPASRWPARPAAGFEESLAVLLEAVDGLYRQRPFAVLLADCGAYRLPLLRTVHQRYGVAALSSGRPLAGWLGQP